MIAEGGEVSYRKLQRRPVDPAQATADRNVMIEILSALSEPDREAVIRFYVDRVADEVIEKAQGWSSGRVRDLRRSVRTPFFERNRH